MRVVSIALFLSFVAACGRDFEFANDQPEAGAPDARPSACTEAANHSDLAWLEVNVFKPNCSGSGSCHKGEALLAGELNLEVGNVHTNLVGKASKLFPDRQLVVPGDAAASYLMIIMGQYDGPLDPDVGTMPYNFPLSCQPKRDAIERWIAAGALAVGETPASDAGVDAGLDAGVDAAASH